LFEAAGDEVPSQGTPRCRPPQLANSQVLVLRYTRAWKPPILNIPKKNSRRMGINSQQWQIPAKTPKSERTRGDEGNWETRAVRVGEISESTGIL